MSPDDFFLNKNTIVVIISILVHIDRKNSESCILLSFFFFFWGGGGWSGCAKVLGKLTVPGRPTILITVGQGSAVLAVDAGGCGLDIFTLIYPFSSLSPSLWETARYRLKYCLKGPLKPKTTNQPKTIIFFSENIT